MTAQESTIRGSLFRSMPSMKKWPRRLSARKSIDALIQPAAVSAVAMPASWISGKRQSASTMFVATAMPAKIIGVRVSSRAK